jgi:murein peptide amidase A
MKRSYNELSKRLYEAASLPTVTLETLGEFSAGGKTYPLFVMQMGEPGLGKRGVTISAGIHGDEPAGPEAALKFVLENAANKTLLSSFYFTIFPCDNPSGWELDTRENADGIDLNREFAARHPAPEVVLIMKALEGKCFDIVVEMHEDIDAPGFYLYELAEKPEEKVGERIVEAVAAAGYPINLNSCIEGLPAQEGVISPAGKRFRKTHLPKAVYTYRTCGGHVLTLEPPVSVLPIEDRVKIELMALNIVLESKMKREYPK